MRRCLLLLLAYACTETSIESIESIRSPLVSPEWIVDLPVTQPIPGTEPVVASDGTQFLLARRNGPSLQASIVTASGTFLDTFDVSTGVPLAAVFDGTNYVLLWRTSVATNTNIRGARITPSGTLLDPNGFDVAVTSEGENFADLAVASGSTMIIWTQEVPFSDSDVRISRLQGTTLLDPGGIVIGSTNGRPSIAGAGATFFAAWEQHVFADVRRSQQQPVLLARGFSRSTGPRGGNRIIHRQLPRGADLDCVRSAAVSDRLGGVGRLLQ